MKAQLRAQEDAGLLRRAPEIKHLGGLRYEVHGKPVLSFCSNDFLGFGAEEISIQPGARSGSGASRLVHGNHAEIRELERAFAERLGYEDGILLASGYQANLAGLAQLPVHEGTRIFSDKLNHASIIDGLRLGKHDKEITDHLSAPPQGPHWWITESRYSMDGDAPTASALDRHLQQNGYLYLDEAHRFGLEENGQGLAASLVTRPQLANYPLGKAFGLQGALLLGKKQFTDWTRQFARAYIYTTAASPHQCRMIRHRAESIFGEPGDLRRAQLQQNIERVRETISPKTEGPILSLPIGDNHLALQASRSLLDYGFHVQAIRPPTVPAGTARLRITISALHQFCEIGDLARALRQIEGVHLP